MSLKNVILIGAGGNVGEPILNALLNDSAFNVTVLSRQGSNSTFPSGVKVIHADYDSAQSLKEAFQGQDVAISLVGAAALGKQIELIDAAIEAGVKRFIPSEFGNNTLDKRNCEIVPVFEPKVATFNYLKSKESQISWTVLFTGAFFDWGLKVGLLGFNGSSKTATLYDDGKAIFMATNLHQIGLAMTKCLKKADLTKNQIVYASSFRTSQEEILGAAEKITGTKWTVENRSVEKLLEDGRARFQKGDHSAIPNLIQAMIFNPRENLGDAPQEGLWNDKLDLPKEDFESSVRDALGL